MKQIKHFCDRCNKDCEIDGNKVYALTIAYRINKDDFHEVEVCPYCLTEFKNIIANYLDNK